MALPTELKNWKITVHNGGMHLHGVSGGVSIKTSQIVRVDGDVFETAIGARFSVRPADMNKSYWDVTFRTVHALHFEKVKHLFK